MEDGNERSFDQFAHYALGRISQELETLALNAGIPAGILAARVATLLFNSESGFAPRVADSMPTLRGNGTARGETLGAVAVARGSHSEAPGKRRLSAAARARIAAAQRKRWRDHKRNSRNASKTKTARGAAKYWKENFPTPEARAHEVARRRRVALKNKGVQRVAA